MKKILIVSAALALSAVGLMAAEQATAQMKPPPGTYASTPQGQFGFFAAPQSGNSNHVGIFIARRMPGKEPQIFYCSSPADAMSKDPSGCRLFPPLK